jgi:hypothetical protein
MLPVGRSGARLPAGATDIFFYSPELPDLFWGPPSLLYVLSPTLKLPGIEIDPSSPRRVSAVLFGRGQLF